MVPHHQIQQWKAQYEEVYMVTIQDQVFYYRLINREEYEDIVAQELPYGKMQEAVCEVAVLHPVDFDFETGGAGYAEALCDLILEASGFLGGQIKELLEEYRKDMQLFDNQVDCIIHEVFPEYRIEEIRRWSAKKTMWYLARAEYVLENLRGVKLVAVEANEQTNQMDQQPPQPAPAPKQMMSPQERAESSPLATYQQPDAKPQMDKKAATQAPPADEAAMLAMLQQAMMNHPSAQGNRQIAPPTTSLDSMPELSWFRAEEELKGEFD